MSQMDPKTGEQRFAYGHAWLTADEIEKIQQWRPINRTKAEHFQDSEWALFYALHSHDIANVVTLQMGG